VAQPSPAKSFDVTNKAVFSFWIAWAGRMLYPLKRRRLGAFVLQAMVGLMVASLAGPAAAQRSGDFGRFQTAGVPVMAIVSLSRQRVAVYDARGKMLEAPVSTGKTGYDTPPGIYSVIQKNRDHYSNLYDDAAMPFMQRITWSGIALHAGALPGYPASHGCIRMPHEFAGQLFDLTRMGMRVVVVRDDMSPVDFAHPALFKPGPVGPSPTQLGAHVENVSVALAPTRRSIAAAKAVAAEVAAMKAQEARRASVRARQEAAEFLEKLEVAEEAKTRAEATIEEAERLLEMEGSSGFGQKLNAIKAKAHERLAGAQAQIDAIHAEGKAEIDAAFAAREEAKAARAANVAAQNEAKLVADQMAPVSVFISRKTQRLYVRQAFEPLFESAVTIRDPGVPIGTTIFTALNYTGKDAADLRWSALSMYADAASPKLASGFLRSRGGGSARTNADAAKAALERIAMPQDAIDRINELISPGSSLIISDETTSRETGKGTDFVVLMSGEPQGGIKRRPRNPYIARGYDGPFPPGGNPSPFFWW
jgi:hypothetical protein